MTPSTLTTFVGLVLGVVGVTTVNASQVQAVIAAGMALIIAVHTIIKRIEKRDVLAAGVEVAKAKAATTAAVAAARVQTVGSATNVVYPDGIQNPGETRVAL